MNLRYTKSMRRTTVTYLTTTLLLLMNIQAAMSDVGEIFHQDSGLEFTLSADTADADEDSHCQHCCHTHASNISADNSPSNLYCSIETHFYHQIGKSGPASGPPTPPPNA